MEPQLELREGWVEAELAEEFPQLRLVHAAVRAAPARSPISVVRRLHALADRYTGAKVIHMRQDPVPWAYRVFSRQVGIDPDSDRPPAEALALERLRHGGIKSRNLVDDALTIAIAETGVPVIALDAAKVHPELGVRLARAGERLSELRSLRERQLVVADANRPVAVVLGEVSEEAGVTPSTEAMVLAALQVKGVPQISVEEALWTAAEVLHEQG
ncbi:MAG TPA: B3/4 domain-containing protein [Thermoleophilaceae bacterium]|nr:B3/4 domain-containing protein [Thermoleophilaceae bacterium]